MSLLPVEEALRRVLASVREPVPPEEIPLEATFERTLAHDLTALRTQPPFPASSMDGYAVRAGDVTSPPATLRVIGASIAGQRFIGGIGPGEAVRIFTGAPVPNGADAVVAQEDTRREGDSVTVLERAAAGRFVRPSGLDFREGDTLLLAGQRLDARRLSLAAAMGHARLAVRRRPRVAILATGDELVRPGETPGPDQIVASNIYALAGLVARAGGEAIDLGIARDTFADLERAIAAARAASADLLVTLGGASVGEHDLVQSALAREGMELGFWRVALRPGKPLMHGRLGDMVLLGLPGNPVSSIVCAILFVIPAIRALLGDARAAADPSQPATLGAALPANDARQDYLRATLIPCPDGLPLARALPAQDSSMLGVLAKADALIVRPPHAPAAEAGDACRIVPLDVFA
jgi:molybdopterin molybdotransferase